MVYFNQVCHENLYEPLHNLIFLSFLHLGTPAIRAISMRDMGTEMTPIASQEPSRTATPNGSSTPLRSPTSSIPSTPRTGEPTTTPAERTDDNNARHLSGKGDKELSEQEMKLKTRREIVALGVQLGKMNIAAWASKDDKNNSSLPADPAELERVEYEKRAAAWEEAEKSKHAARFLTSLTSFLFPFFFYILFFMGKLRLQKFQHSQIRVLILETLVIGLN